MKSPLNLSKSVTVNKVYSMLLILFALILLPLSLSKFLWKSSLLEWSLMKMGPASIILPLILDTKSILFAEVVMMISSSVLWYSYYYMDTDNTPPRFTLLVVLFVLSMSLLIFIPSLIALILGWDGLGLVSFCLVIYYQNKKSLAAGVITALMNRVGDACLIAAMALCLNLSHWNLMSMNQVPSLAQALLFLAAMTKSAQMPFSAWLPAAMAAPTPVSALVHSSTLVTAGVYILIRFFPFLTTSQTFKTSTLLLGLLTASMASLAAIKENDLKKVIALSTLSQLGLMFSALFLMSPMICLFHLLTHALFKALLFLAAGNIIHLHSSTQDIRLVGHLSSSLPTTSAAMNIANFALMGTPFLAAFYSKDLIIQATELSLIPGPILYWFLASLALTAAYSLRLSFLMLWSSYNQPPTSNVTDSNKNVYSPMTTLSIGAIVGGAIMQWSLSENFSPPTSPMLLTVSPSIPLISGLILGALLVLFSYSNPPSKAPMAFFLTSMWHLKDLTSLPINLSSLILSNNSKNLLDHGWNEIMTAKGTQKTLTETSNPSSSTEKSPLPSILLTTGAVMLIPMILQL
uniref:NADH-ubiquinone oxidoreductase chain 5 n=1 Tax=Terebratulina retusa TaxID=7580 RepID=Q9T9N5_9BILA|nr:NADH dehydrogenase subunit 5 [Terebratulina retusa]CAB59851.1 NADH dehydrogenase subunit 5 [Terebratulina retusa]